MIELIYDIETKEEKVVEVADNETPTIERQVSQEEVIADLIELLVKQGVIVNV